MQVDCFCFNWEEVKKRSSAEQVVDEMISTDDIDIYSTSLPDGIWNSDSASQHFEVAEALGKFTKDNYSDEYSGADILASLISEGDSIDEIGLSPLTEGCYFISLSPNRVSSINKVFNNIDLAKLSEKCASMSDSSSSDIEQWLIQWKKALSFAESKGLGVIGHCG